VSVTRVRGLPTGRPLRAKNGRGLPSGRLEGLLPDIGGDLSERLDLLVEVLYVLRQDLVYRQEHQCEPDPVLPYAELVELRTDGLDPLLDDVSDLTPFLIREEYAVRAVRKRLQNLSSAYPSGGWGAHYAYRGWVLHAGRACAVRRDIREHIPKDAQHPYVCRLVVEQALDLGIHLGVRVVREL